MAERHFSPSGVRGLAVLALVAVALALLLSGCASVDGRASDTASAVPTVSASPTALAAASPTAPPTASPTPLPSIALEPCYLGAYGAECGTMSVFENRAAQSGRKIGIRVAVIRARDSEPAPDAIFLLAGGPGGAAIEDAPGAMAVLSPANQTRDLVFVDQRGTGGSNKLECPIPSDPASQVDGLRACLANLDADPRAYTTAWAMDDVDDVRAALGYDKINLYGGSYGATAEQVYILRHGEHVRTAFLDGGSLLDVPLFERFPASSQSALDKLLARCEADSTCQSAYPRVRQELSDLLTKLDSGPLTTTVVDPRTGQAAQLDRQAFDTGMHSLLVSTPASAMVPKAIHMVYTSDWTALQALTNPSSSPDTSGPTWMVMNLTILCHEEWAKTRRSETEALAAGSYMRYSDVRAIIQSEDVCNAVPKPEPAALYGPTKPSPVPILLVNGEVDPQDPPANVAGAKELYPTSLSVVFPGQAHQHTGASCLASIEADLVERGSVDGLSTECLNQIALPPFVP